MDAALIVTIRAAHAASKGTYGAPRLQVDLAAAGIRVGRKRVARLMRTAGLAGVSRRRHTVTTVRDGARQAPDLVDRDFTAERPNMLWVADITYVPTWAGAPPSETCGPGRKTNSALRGRSRGAVPLQRWLAGAKRLSPEPVSGACAPSTGRLNRLRK
jgi:transposase InsO family protein